MATAVKATTQAKRNDAALLQTPSQRVPDSVASMATNTPPALPMGLP